MDRLIETELAAFLDASRGLEEPIPEQASAVSRAFVAQRDLILVSTRARKPDMTSPAFQDLVRDLQREMAVVGDIKDANRAGGAVRDQLAMVGEGMGALQWVVFDGKPAEYVGEVLGGVQMFGNRVLKEKCVFLMA